MFCIDSEWEMYMMLTNMNNKSKFDKGNWSPVNGLPAQNDIINYLEHLFSTNPNQCFTRNELMDSVVQEFGIPPVKAEADGPGSQTAAFYTRMTYLITDAIQGKRRASKAFAKRLDHGLYQSINGNGVPNNAVTAKVKVSQSLVARAMVSVKILKELNHSTDQIINELSHLWDAPVVSAAIEKVFV